MTAARAAARPSAGAPHVVQVVQAIDRGGLEMMAVELAVALHARGFGSSVLALNGGGRLEARLREAGVPFALVGNARYLDPASHGAVWRALRRLRPAAVHTHHLPALLNTAPAAALAGAGRVVHTEHSHLYLDEQPRFRHYLRWAARGADAVALVGGALRPYYTDVVGLPASRVRVVANGVNTDRFAPIGRDEAAARRRASGLPTGGLLVGAVGRIAAVKDYPMLLRAVARARADGAPVAAALVGDGEDRGAVERLARDLGLGDAVQFLGWRTDVADLVGAFDVLTVTSSSEALPLVVLEAMSAGIPVVSTAVGEIPQVLEEGRAGFLVPPGDDAALAAVLRRLAAAPELGASVGARGRARILRDYDHRAMVDAYLALYGLAEA